jgi:hypothetical protein
MSLKVDSGNTSKPYGSISVHGYGRRVNVIGAGRLEALRASLDFLKLSAVPARGKPPLLFTEIKVVARPASSCQTDPEITTVRHIMLL